MTGKEYRSCGDDAFVSISKNAKKAEGTRSGNSSSGVMYELRNGSSNSASLPDFEIKKDTVVINERLFPQRDISNSRKYSIIKKQVRNMLKKLSGQSVIVKNNEHEIFFDETFAYEYTGSKDSLTSNKSRRNIKINSAKHIKKIMETAEYYNHQEAKTAEKNQL